MAKRSGAESAGGRKFRSAGAGNAGTASASGAQGGKNAREGGSKQEHQRARAVASLGPIDDGRSEFHSGEFHDEAKITPHPD